MFVNYYLAQVEEGWITINQVPKKYRAKVKKLLEKTIETEEDKEA